jgi:hypothetical protein
VLELLRHIGGAEQMRDDVVELSTGGEDVHVTEHLGTGSDPLNLLLSISKKISHSKRPELG